MVKHNYGLISMQTGFYATASLNWVDRWGSCGCTRATLLSTDMLVVISTTKHVSSAAAHTARACEQPAMPPSAAELTPGHVLLDQLPAARSRADCQPTHACADLLVCAQEDQHYQVLELVLTTLTDKRTLFHLSILSQDTQRLVHGAVRQRLPAFLPVFLKPGCSSDGRYRQCDCNEPACAGPAMRWLCHAAGPAAVSSASAARAVLNNRGAIHHESLMALIEAGVLPLLPLLW